MTTPSLRVLFVDADSASIDDAVSWFAGRGHCVSAATSFVEALRAFERQAFDVVVTESDLVGRSGLDLLPAVGRAGRDCGLIVLSARGAVEAVVEAMRRGARDYLVKPCLPEAIERGCLRVAEAARGRGAGRTPGDAEIVGRSAPIVELLRLIDRVGPSGVPVLIEGESGTGKELVAAALQRASRRDDAAFVAVNCAALPEQLLESEFFGHEKGAFTGAAAAKPGLFEAADGGTLFIDEIAELALPLQAKLLRVLENGSYRRVGSVTERRADVRVIAATNRDLAAEVSAHRFREDLYYRINVVTLRLPPLRDRRGDVARLVAAFLGTDWQLDTDASAAVERYRWPGNVRQLRNALERAKVFAARNTIRLCDLPVEVALGACDVPPGPAHDDIESQQREHVLKVLAREHGNKARAARLLGVDRRSLYRLLERYAAGVPDAGPAMPR